MRVWRIDKDKHVAQALSGEGARLYGGRWNPTGRAVVYTAATLSLAALERLVHHDYDLAPPSLVAVAIDVPDTLAVEQVGAPPADWRAIRPPASTVAIGEAWLDKAVACVLAVPSVVVDHELNYVLNPAHPEFSQIAIVETKPFAFDPRLLV